MSAALELDDLTKRYGTVLAVDGLSLSVPEGSLFGLVGPNGAGKTTTFSLVAGFLRPDRGVVRVRGEALKPGQPRVGRVLVLPQDANFPPKAKAIEVLVLLGRLSGLDAGTARDRGRAALSRLGIGDSAERPVGTLSHGQRRRVAIAQALLGDQEVVVLDEPTAGLDPVAAAELRALILELRGERTIVLSSHNLAEVEAVCDRVAIINSGKLVSSGSMDELRRASSRVRVHLGGAPSDTTGMLDRLTAISGLLRVEQVPDEPLVIELEVEDGPGGRADAVASEVLRVLLELGVSIRSMERGQSLEERFLEDVAPSGPR